ncbi:hypothetical protein EDC04DRAFT_2610924 [Pisolithus marmoratus]|nr:hypothetical protein EDC04DRAFT_2610924 [Pisolithus marmoratus]
MAPGYAEDEQESQIPLWAVESIPPFSEQSPEVQPSFKQSQPSQQFGFKHPSQASTGGMQSTRSYNSCSSSGNPSIFLAPVSQGSSVSILFWYPCPRPTSSSSQWVPLAPSMTSRAMSIPIIFSAPFNHTKSHTIFTKNTGGGLDPGEDDLVIDDVSLSEDVSLNYVAFVGSHGISQNIPKPSCGNTSAEAVVCGESVAGDHCHSGQPDKSHSQSGALQFQGDHRSTNMQQIPNSNSDPSHLQFYTLPVHDIIKHVKQISHCDIVSNNSFPLHADFNHKAPEYMNEAIAEHCSQDLAIPDTDHGNWHSALKKTAHVFVCDHYEWDLQNHFPISVELAKSLLEHGNFLRHRVDIEGHMNNFAHPALSGLIINFFYMGSNAITSIFPEVFEKEVPCIAVVLAATTIKVALDEMVVEGKEVTFKCDIYVDVYIDLLGLMAKCDTAPVRHAKTKVLCVECASIGMNGSATSGMNMGFDVDLD